MKDKLNEIYEKQFYKRPTRLILFMYLVAIFIATILLILPISSADGTWTNPLDALFTIVSAICVTGLVTVTTASHWTFFGKLVIIFVIQLGGLGIMTAASIVALLLNKKMSISTRLNLSEEKNAASIEGIVKVIKFVIFSTFLIEFIGAVLLSFTFIPDYGISKGIWYSIFHSISAYCNAGFDIIGDISLVPYARNFNVSMVISSLIIIGGLGYTVFKDLMKNKLAWNKYRLHTKLVLISTLLLMVVPTILFIALEYNNMETLGQYGFFDKILVSWFQAATLRTAGFFTSNQAFYFNSSVLLMIVLMFIGGSPAGTAGGFKTTSFVSLLFITRANVKDEKDVTILKRRLPEDLGSKVTSIFTISLIWIFCAILIISTTDPGFEIIDVFYEVISAYATVGLTRGITPSLSVIAKLVIIATMLFGKVGPLSIIIALTRKSKTKSYKEKEESILIG